MSRNQSHVLPILLFYLVIKSFTMQKVKALISWLLLGDSMQG